MPSNLLIAAIQCIVFSNSRKVPIQHMSTFDHPDSESMSKKAAAAEEFCCAATPAALNPAANISPGSRLVPHWEETM